MKSLTDAASNNRIQMILSFQCMVDPLLKEYSTAGVDYSKPLSASYSKQEKLTPVVIDDMR